MHGLKEASEQLEQYALEYIEREYGADGKNPRPYHNAEHTNSAVYSAKMLAKALHLTQREILLLTIAASFHDLVHNGDSDPDNERLSADEAGKKMKEYPVFTDTDIAKVKQMILATHCIAKYPKIVQTPAQDDICSMVLCDADLSSFGKPYDQFLKSSDCYFDELYPGEIHGSNRYRKYLEAEIVILKNHEFWTTKATEIFPYKQENIQKLLELIK